MAADLALLDRAGGDEAGTLRTYRWARPTVSFGRNERVRDVWDVAALGAAGYDVVRRPTGGRALLHVHEVTWAVALPLPRAVPWRSAYDAVNARLVAALCALGVPATLVADAPALAPDGPACFAAPATGEIAVAGRKLVGSAVWRSAEAYLQHGSILLHDAQGALAAYRRAGGTDEVLPPAAGLAAWLEDDAPAADTDAGARDPLPGATSDEALRRRVVRALREAFGVEPPTPLRGDPRRGGPRRGGPRRESPQSGSPAVHDDDERERVDAHRLRLAEPAWLWRR
jgi:lipoate-protein ligase A